MAQETSSDMDGLDDLFSLVRSATQAKIANFQDSCLPPVIVSIRRIQAVCSSRDLAFKYFRVVRSSDWAWTRVTITLWAIPWILIRRSAEACDACRDKSEMLKLYWNQGYLSSKRPISVGFIYFWDRSHLVWWRARTSLGLVHDSGSSLARGGLKFLASLVHMTRSYAISQSGCRLQACNATFLVNGLL